MNKNLSKGERTLEIQVRIKPNPNQTQPESSQNQAEARSQPRSNRNRMQLALYTIVSLLLHRRDRWAGSRQPAERAEQPCQG